MVDLIKFINDDYCTALRNLSFLRTLQVVELWDCSVFLLVRLYRNNGFVAVNFMVNILVCYSWIGSFGVGI